MKIRNVLGILILVLLLGQCTFSASSPTVVPVKPTGVPTSTPTPAPTRPVVGRLVVLSEPAGASIRVGQVGGETPWKAEGETPWKAYLRAGRYDLELSLPGYKGWTGRVEVVAGETITVEVRLESCFRVLFILAPEPQEDLRFLEWEADGLALRYAYGDFYSYSPEPKDWAWYRYNLLTGEVEVLPPPQSHVSDEVRAALGLCPLDRRQATPLCRLATALSEAPSGTHMVYAPPEVVLGPDGEPWGGLFNLWHADVQGQNRVFLGNAQPGGEGGGPGLSWSPQENWVLVNVSYETGDFYLAKVDGTVFEHLPPVPEVYTYFNIRPSFSPDDQKIAFIGSSDGCHATWILALDGSNQVRKVSDHIGLLQWSADSRYLYVFDIVGKTLYRVDLAETPPQERVVVTGLPLTEGIKGLEEPGYTVRGLPAEHLGIGNGVQYWALSPDERRIVYMADGVGWSVLEIAPECMSR